MTPSPMDANAKGVDVLAVMDAAILHLTNPAAITLPTAAGLKSARDAVSELIEFAKAREAARKDVCDYYEAPGNYDREAAEELCGIADEATARFLAALAACGVQP